MIQRSAAALVLSLISLALLVNVPFAQAAGADSSLVVAALHVVEQNYVKQVDPIRLLNAAIVGLRKATKQGEDVLPNIPNGAAEARAVSTFRSEFDQAVKAGGVSEADLAYAATREMLASLHDSHVYYMDPTAFKLRQDQEAGKVKYEGIGIQLSIKKGESDANEFFVGNVFPGSPAAAAGLKRFDRLIEVDGKSIVPTAAADDVGNQIRGPAGSSVALTVQRGGQTISYSISRGSIQFPQVEASTIQPGVAYVKLYSFSTGVGDQLRGLLRPLIAQGGLRSIVLDLRGNWGGYLREAESVAGIFLPSQTTLVRVLPRAGGVSTLVARGDLLLPKAALTVLTDQGTASSSEVVVAGLKSTHRATIIGKRTAGALSWAREVSLPIGGMYVTINEVVGPQNEQIERVGIAPDNEIELSVSDLERGVDTQLDAALKTLGGAVLSGRIAA